MIIQALIKLKGETEGHPFRGNKYTEGASAPVVIIIVKGEGPGHPFRGNQYSGGFKVGDIIHSRISNKNYKILMMHPNGTMSVEGETSSDVSTGQKLIIRADKLDNYTLKGEKIPEFKPDTTSFVQTTDQLKEYLWGDIKRKAYYITPDKELADCGVQEYQEHYRLLFNTNHPEKLGITEAQQVDWRANESMQFAEEAVTAAGGIKVMHIAKRELDIGVDLNNVSLRSLQRLYDASKLEYAPLVNITDLKTYASIEMTWEEFLDYKRIKQDDEGELKAYKEKIIIVKGEGPGYPFRGNQYDKRFYMEPSDNILGGYMIVDTEDGFLIDFETKAAAKSALSFARKYAKKYGDIYFGSFPYSLDQPLLSDENLEKLNIPKHKKSHKSSPI